jgi:hypothetical protein
MSVRIACLRTQMLSWDLLCTNQKSYPIYSKVKLKLVWKVSYRENWRVKFTIHWYMARHLIGGTSNFSQRPFSRWFCGPLVLLPHPKASYENSRHEGINSGMLLLAITILMANVLNMAGFKFYRSFILCSPTLKTCSHSNLVPARYLYLKVFILK